MSRLIPMFIVILFLIGCSNEKVNTKLEDIYQYIEQGEDGKVLEGVSKKNINEQLEGMDPIILYSASLGHDQLTSSLLKYNPDLNTINHIGNNLLHVAAENNLVHLTKELLSQQMVEVNSKNSFSHTPLLIAMMQGNEEIVEMLLNHGADPNIKSEEQFSPLHESVSKGNLSIVEKLLSSGAQIDTTTSTGMTPLMLAAQTGNKAMIKLLIEKGADINKQDQDHYSALAYGILYNNIDTVSTLLEYEPRTNITLSGNISLVELARYSENSELVSLVEKGVGKK